MSTRNVDTAIRYAISITEKGLKAAVALTTDLSKQSKVAQGAVDASMKAVQAQYSALERVALKADASVARAAIDSATQVNKALDSQVLKMREAGSSYAAIIAKQTQMGASARDLAASVEASSKREIAAMQAVRAEADRTVRQRISTAASGARGRVAPVAAGAASAVGGLTVGALGGATALALIGLEKSRGITEGTLAIRGATGLPTNQSLPLAVIGAALGIAPQSIGQAFGTLGTQTTQFLAGGAKATTNFKALGISAATARADQNNPLALFDLVTERARQLPATQQATVQRALLGRGSSIVGQLTAGGPLTASVAAVQKDLPGLDPKKLLVMQEAFVHLQEAKTAFELSFAQSFGPSIAKALDYITPKLPKIAAGFKDAFGFIKGLVEGPVGQALGKFGSMAFEAGKKLVEAFKPAQPFFSNVLLPLVKGFAEGIAIGLLGAINLVTAAVKIFAPILGSIGTFLAPAKVIIEDVGGALGVFFGGAVLGTIAKGIGLVVGEIPLIGKAFEFIIKPVEFVGEGIAGLYKIIAGTFGKIFGFLPGVGPTIGKLLGSVVATVVGAFAAIPDAIGGVFSGLADIIAGAFVTAINTTIDVINAGAGVINSITNALGVGNVVGKTAHLSMPSSAASFGPVTSGNAAKSGGAKHGGAFRNGGLAFAEGGLVPAMVSPGEQVIYGGRAAMVPGAPAAADSVFAMLPAGAAVMTGHGQALMGMGASLGDALDMQMPHFGPGGVVDPNALITAKAKTPAGSKATPKYINNVLIGSFTTAGWHAYLLAHPKASTQGIGLSFSGPASTFGPPNEAAATTAYGGSTTLPGVALNPHGGGNWNDTLARSLAGKAFRIEGAGHSAVLKVIDKGPSAIGRHGARLIDITGAGVQAMGLDPRTFPTDATFKATQVLGGVASAVTAAQLKKQTPTLANLVASLTGQSAFAGGYQAGLAGNTLMDTLRSGVLSSAISDAAVNVNTASAAGVSAAASTVSSAVPTATAGLVNWSPAPHHNKIASWIAPELRKAQARGWRGAVTSGWRSLADQTAIWNSGVRPAARPGTSNHEQANFPGGAVDASDAPSLGRILASFRSPLVWAGAKDPVHFSHPHGGGYRKGGLVLNSAPVLAKRPAVSPLRAPLGTVGSLLGQSDATDVGAVLEALAGQLDNVHKLTVGSLEQLASSLAKHSRKGLDTIQARRLDTALNLVDAAIGNRIGLQVAAAQEQVDKLGRDKHHITALQTMLGIDPGSVAGLKQITAIDQQTAAGINNQVGVLNQALATAKRYGDKATIKDVTDKLNTALGALDDAAAQVMVDIRAGIERATQDLVDSATQAVSVAQAGEQILGLQQQLAGTDQSPGAGQATAAYITQTVLPALQQQLRAQQADQAAASSVGDTSRANADILAELQTQTSILTEQKTAQDAIKANTAPLKAFGGQLALNFSGNTYTDQLASMAGV
jgi:hypothetical protein